MQLPEIKLFPHQQRSLDETERFENAAYYLDMRWVLVKLSLDRSLGLHFPLDSQSGNFVKSRKAEGAVMDVLVFMAVVFGDLYVYDAVKTKSLRKAAHVIFDLGDESNEIQQN